MPTIIRAPSTRGTSKPAVRRRESWFFIATGIIVLVLAAAATIATVLAYGPMFLAPANGP